MQCYSFSTSDLRPKILYSKILFSSSFISNIYQPLIQNLITRIILGYTFSVYSQILSSRMFNKFNSVDTWRKKTSSKRLLFMCVYVYIYHFCSFFILVRHSCYDIQFPLGRTENEISLSNLLWKTVFDFSFSRVFFLFWNFWFDAF